MAGAEGGSPRRRRWWLGAACALALAGLVALVTRQPEPADEPLRHGLRYLRVVRETPAQVIHRVIVPLDRRRRFVVTHGDPAANRALRAQTTSTFARRHEVDVAINGDFFRPWHSHGPWDYYPHEGDPVDVAGVAIANGVSYGATETTEGATLWIPCEGKPTTRPPADPCHAVSGKPLLIAGEPAGPGTSGSKRRHPRSAVCLDAPREHLMLVVVDGRQPGRSVGMTLDELRAELRGFGCHDAINLDGGGSSSLVLRRGPTYEPANTPIHTRVPGRERPIANHFGVVADG